MKQVIVLVLSAWPPPYDKLYQALRETWGKNQPGFQVICYFGQGGQAKPGDLICDCPDTAILQKTLLAFKHVHKTFKYDYIFRCCAGSYIVAPELLKFVKNAPSERFYCGIQGTYPPGTNNITYASGSGFFLSSDLVKKAVDGPVQDCGWDDVSLGAFFGAKGIGVAPGARRVNINFAGDSSRVIPGEYHYHFTTDIRRMYDIHKNLEHQESL